MHDRKQRQKSVDEKDTGVHIVVSKFRELTKNIYLIILGKKDHSRQLVIIIHYRLDKAFMSGQIG